MTTSYLVRGNFFKRMTIQSVNCFYLLQCRAQINRLCN